MKINLLYLGYWSISEPLTVSVIQPRLQVIAKHPSIKSIVFISVERGVQPQESISIEKVKWIPFFSSKRQSVVLTKVGDFTRLPSLINKLVKSHDINLVIANSPLAGGACILANVTVPLIVECFEPHADSMVESKVWKKYDPRYLSLKYLERRQKQSAWKLQVVSQHFKNRLQKEGIDDSKIEMLANCLRIKEFAFNAEIRQFIRSELGWQSTDRVGIYVGKFGGIYYDEEAFDLFARAYHYFNGSLRLIFITAHPKEKVSFELQKRGIENQHFFISKMPHNLVASYLSAADFAFATIKPSDIRLYCCPVKNGEYWANGLPILLENGIGDDSDIIKADGGGLIIDTVDLDKTFDQLEKMIARGRENYANEVMAVAKKFRRIELMEEYYAKIFKHFEKEYITIAES